MTYRKYKSHIPLRPMLLMIDSPVHKLSRLLANHLEIIRSKLSLCYSNDNYQFVKMLEMVKITGSFI